MSGLLALLAGGGGAPAPTPPVVPTSAPWNTTTYLTIPTPDGTGSTVHPGVYDFGSGRKWRGWRYWMAHTPFLNGNDQLENPCIAVSNDGWRWHTPSGLTNPVYPTPPDMRFNSDTEIAYDPRTDELVLVYREKLANGDQETFFALSPDGVTWPAKAQKINWTRPGDLGDDAYQQLSPAIVRRGDDDWWLFTIEKGRARIAIYRATSPDGVWTGPAYHTGTLARAWHGDILWDGSKFMALVDTNGTPDGLTLGTSADGYAWTFNNTPVLGVGPAGAWDSTMIYRSTFTIHENGTHARVWYAANGPESWRLGYTELPLSLWPAPPA